MKMSEPVLRCSTGGYRRIGQIDYLFNRIYFKHSSILKQMKFMNKIWLCAILLGSASLPGLTQDLPEVPIIEDGQAQVIPAFNDPTKWIRHDLWVETEFDTDGDGLPDRMHVAVTRPQATEDGLKLPVVYNSSPYFAGTAKFEDGLFWDVKHELGEAGKPRTMVEVERRGTRPIISTAHTTNWVPRGFIVVHSSAPGTGLSQGAPTIGGANESLAPKAVIEWLTGKDNGYTTPYGDEKIAAYWSNGNVGMTGTSYNGTIPLAAATTGVDGLKAVIPVAPNTSYYHYYRSHGLVRSPGGYLGEDVDVLYDFIHSGDESRRAYNNRVYRDSLFALGMDRQTGDYNEFWKERDMIHDMDGMKAALFMSHGFNDWNVMPEHSYRIYDKAREMGLPVKIYYHQEGHGGPPPFEMMNKWFTKYLFEVDNGAEEGPRAWIVRENDPRDQPTAYADYPNPEAQPVTLYPSGNGTETGTLSPRQNRARIRTTFTDDVSVSGGELAQAEASGNRLLYTTPELQQDLHLSGIAEVSVRLASSKPAANLSVWLVSLPWNTGEDADITENIITRGWADPQNAASLTESEPLQPGKFYDITFTLQPDDQVIPAGQKIGFMIFSSDREFTLWPEAGTEISVDLSRTNLVLPVVGGAAAINAAMTPSE